MRNRSLMGGVFLCAVLSLGIALSGLSHSAEPEKSTAKPKPSDATKPAAKTVTATQTKFQSAETAEKAPTCFGMAPSIDKISPDEGKAGDKVTITGTSFGNSDCLRSISFGPGHAATFKVESDGKISTTVPSGGRRGLAMLTVTTASGETSKTFLVK
ncbi:MAG: IPT/TIG domain-containing protein [Nitrospirota bacterium]